MAIRLYPIFADWRSRPGRADDFRNEKRDYFPSEDMWAREYPEEPADLFKAADELIFSQAAILIAQAGAIGPEAPIGGHTYIKYWDIGRLQDASVCCVLDITQAPYQLVHYRRVYRKPYPVIQSNIEAVHELYPGETYIEDNGAGRAVAENVSVPVSNDTIGAKNKVDHIIRLKMGMERGYVKFWSEPQIVTELGSYMWDDEGLVQDSVMALSGAVYHAGVPAGFGVKITGIEAGDSDSRTRGLPGVSTMEAMQGSRLARMPGGRRYGRDDDGRSYDDNGQRAEVYLR